MQSGKLVFNALHVQADYPREQDWINSVTHSILFIFNYLMQ